MRMANSLLERSCFVALGKRSFVSLMCPQTPNHFDREIGKDEPTKQANGVNRYESPLQAGGMFHFAHGYLGKRC